MKKRYMTRDQACRYTTLSNNTMMRMAKKAHAVVKIGSRVLIDREFLDKYMKEVRT